MKTTPSASLLWLALPFALFAAGCQKEAAEEARTAQAAETVAEETSAEPGTAPAAEIKTVEPATPPVPVPGTDAAIIEDRSTPAAAAPSFDSKAFQGRFVSGKTALDITADGVFALDTDGAIVNGTWSLQAGGKKATLDPDSKGEADRELDILSNDSVKIVGGATLKRQNGAN